MVIDHYREYKVINSHIKGNIYIIETEEGELIEFPIKNFPYYHRFKKGLLYLNENDEVIYSFSLNSKGKYSTQLDVEIPEVIRSKIPNLTKVSKDEKTQILHICIISSVYNYHNRSTNYIVWDYLNEKYLCLIKWRNWDLNIKIGKQYYAEIEKNIKDDSYGDGIYKTTALVLKNVYKVKEQIDFKLPLK